jgi:surface polysaccharide O-acyltransferase-like enzyme
MCTTTITEYPAKNEPPKKYLVYADFLRIIAVLLIIIGHLCDDLSNYKTILTWFNGSVLGVFYVSFAVISVPIFIMLSGMLLLGKNTDENLAVFYKKRIKKVLIPYIVWMVIYYFHDLIIQGDPFDAIKFIKEILIGWNTDHISWHLWYLPMILSLYIFTPFIKTIMDKLDRTSLIGFLMILFLYESIFPLIGEFFQIQLGLYTYKPMSSYYLFYFVLGYVLNTFDFNIKNRSLLPFFIIGYFTTFLGTMYSFMYGYGTPLYGFNRLNVVLMSTSFFLIMKNLNTVTIKSTAFLKLIKKLSSMTFGVYLVHIIIIELLLQGLGYTHPLKGIPLLLIMTFLLSNMVVYIMQRIPFLKEIVP